MRRTYAMLFLLALGCSNGESRLLLLMSPEESQNVGSNLPEEESPVADKNRDLPPETDDDRVRFALDGRLFALAHGVGDKWVGCDDDQVIPGGYNSNTRCGNGFLHPAFADHLEKYFYECILMASERAGLSEPYRVFMNHLGTYNDRNVAGSSELSFHAYARAMDIAKFNLIDRQGNVTLISTHIRDFDGPTVPFYNEFRSCWASTLEATCSPGDREYRGSVGHTESDMGGNSLHADHIHLSFPFCGGS